MEVTYKDKKLRDLCLQERVAIRELGAAGANKLKTRMANLYAASVVTELVAGHPHPLQGDREGQFALSLDGGRRLVFTPQDKANVTTEAGEIDWARVSKVAVVFVGDYHD